MEKSKQKKLIAIFISIFVIFVGNFTNKGQVYAKYEKEEQISCAMYDGYQKASNNKYYCCPSTYTFNKGTCYDAVSSGFAYTIFGDDSLEGFQPSYSVPKGKCYYKVPFSLGQYGPERANLEIDGTCVRVGDPPKEKDLYIDKSYTKDAEVTYNPCNLNECEGDETVPQIGYVTYCYSLGEKNPNEGFCGCDCNNPDWSTKGFYPTYCLCTGDDPDPNPNGNGSGNNPPPIQLTCAEICDGERIDTDGDGETDQDGPHYSSCIGCICAGSSDSTDFSGNVWTELGCITATQEGLTVAVMRIFIGIVTGIAVIRFIQAGIMLNTDDPEKIKEGKSIAMSAVAAVIFGALMPILLNFIGLDILGIGRIFE